MQHELLPEIEAVANRLASLRAFDPMSIDRFASEISFRFLRPNARLALYPRANVLLSRLSGKRLQLEVLNTRLPTASRTLRARLSPLLTIPRMSTFAIGAIINFAVSQMPTGAAYVNVGVWNGFSFFSGLVGNPDARCIGIDSFEQFGSPRREFMARFEQLRTPNASFYDMDYQAYFRTVHEGPIGFYFYDGHHAYEHQMRGLEAAEPCFVPGTVILVDDTNWDEPRQATLDFAAARPSRYEVIVDRRTADNEHPTLWNGIMMLVDRGVPDRETGDPGSHSS